jgi:ribonuclease HI
MPQSRQNSPQSGLPFGELESDSRNRGQDILTAFVDGGSRGNPGDSGAGVYLLRNGEPWRGLYFYLGRQTNNFAEYTALLEAMNYALLKGFRKMSVNADSELLVRQMLGIYKVKNPGLKPLHAEAREMVLRLQTFSIRHVPREQNKKADALANKAQDTKESGEESYEQVPSKT